MYIEPLDYGGPLLFKLVCNTVLYLSEHMIRYLVLHIEKMTPNIFFGQCVSQSASFFRRAYYALKSCDWDPHPIM